MLFRNFRNRLTLWWLTRLHGESDDATGFLHGARGS